MASVNFQRYQHLLKGFYNEAPTDASLSLSASVIYHCLLYLLLQNKEQEPLLINRREVERLAKVSRTTYQKGIHELKEGGYIHYQPSYNHFLGSLVKFYGFGEIVLRIKVKRDEILFITG